MRALLLAAGLGTRLRPITDSIPKCLVEICGKPLLWYWIDSLVKAGVKDILVNTHYFSEKVEKFLSSCEYRENVKVAYEKELLLTGGTLLSNKDFFKNEPLMLVHADNLVLCSMAEFIKAHSNRPKEALMTMMTFTTDTPESCGIVKLDGKGIVTEFHEKVKNPPSNLANGAVYILEPEIVEFMETLGKEKVDFSTEVIPNFMGKIFVFHNDVYHRDIGNVESLKQANKDMKKILENK